MESIDRVASVLHSIRGDLQAINTNLSWIAGLALVATISSCDSRESSETAIAACQAQQLATHAASPAYEHLCMSSKGFDYRWELPNCSGLTVAAAEPVCFERRGYWLDTKRFLRKHFPKAFQ